MGFFSKKKQKKDDDGDVAVEANPDLEETLTDKEDDEKDAKKKKGKVSEAEGYEPSAKKAGAFFKHAHATAETSQFDYSIDMFTSGLKWDPDNMTEREAMRDVAHKRKAGGGKKATGKDKRGAKTKLERMLVAEKVWAKDPLNFQTALAAMTKAVDVDEIYEQLNVGEVAYWYGEMVMENPTLGDKPRADVFIKLTDLFERIEAWGKAVEACTFAARLAPNNTDLLSRLKDLSAEKTMVDGGYNKTAKEREDGGLSLQSVQDLDAQRLQAAANAISKTDRDFVMLIEAARKQVEEMPDDPAFIRKLARLLAEKEMDEDENEAVEMLRNLHERLVDEYAIKVQYQDVEIRQKNRRLRALKKQWTASPQDADLRDEFMAMRDDVVRFELDVYNERVEQYGTDMKLRYEQGKRLMHFKKYEEAITSFQAAQTDPKLRTRAMRYLGACYVTQDWMQEAVDTFEDAIELHPFIDDDLGKEMRYQLMEAFMSLAEKEKSSDLAAKAKESASQILKIDINYRDIKKKMEQIRKLESNLKRKD